MTNIRELCAQLGFDTIVQFGIHPKHAGDIKYDATALLEESQEFVRQYVAQHGFPNLTEAAVQRNLFTYFVPIAHDFLNHEQFAKKHWPSGSTLDSWRGLKWPEDADLIEDLVAKIIAHKMRNMKKRHTESAEGELELQLEDSSDLLRRYQKGTNIIDLEDWDVDAACDILTTQSQQKNGEKNRTFKEQMIESQHSLNILSSVEYDDINHRPSERRGSRKRRGSSPPWMWTNQLPTPSEDHELIGKHSLRQRAPLDDSLDSPYSRSYKRLRSRITDGRQSAERRPKLRRTTPDSPPSKRYPIRKVKSLHRRHSHPLSTYDSTVNSIEPAKSPAADAMSSSVTSKLPPKQLTVSTPDINFHFFGSNPSLGAIPKPYTTVSSPNSFFGAAMEAWMLTGPARPRVMALSAVSVTWEGGKRPVMVPWHDAEGFQGMVSAIKKAEQNGEVEVEVRCIAQV